MAETSQEVEANYFNISQQLNRDRTDILKQVENFSGKKVDAESIIGMCRMMTSYLAVVTQERNPSLEISNLQIMNQERVTTANSSHTILGINDAKSGLWIAADATPQQIKQWEHLPISEMKIFGPYSDEREMVEYLGSQ